MMEEEIWVESRRSNRLPNHEVLFVALHSQLLPYPYKRFSHSPTLPSSSKYERTLKMLEIAHHSKNHKKKIRKKEKKKCPYI